MSEEESYHNIHPELRNLAFPVDQLVPDSENARRHDERNIKAIVDSYREHGQLKPLVVQSEDHVVRAGNGQLIAAQRLGWTHVAVVRYEADRIQQMVFALRDNRSADLAEWDLPQLGEWLREITETYPHDLVGFAEDEVTPLIDADWSPPVVDPEADFDLPGTSKSSASSAQTRHLVFSEEQWAELGRVMGKEPTSEDVMDWVRTHPGTGAE